MKTTRKIVALMIAMMLVSAMAVSAFAVTITITRDSSFTSGSSGTNQYSWYRVFKADYASGSATTGGGPNSYWYNSGTKSGTINVTHTNASYIASNAVAMKLVEWNSSTGKWERVTENKWFDLTPIAGTVPVEFTVSWSTTSPSNYETIQAAAAWLVSVGAYEASDVMTLSNGKWTADVDKGYYVIKGTFGTNLIAATTNITINEKNTYPTVKKTSSGSIDPVALGVGKLVPYEVEVRIPEGVKKDDIITVWDTPSPGLTYVPSTLTITMDGTSVKNDPGLVSLDAEAQTNGNAWRYKITFSETGSTTSVFTPAAAGKKVIFKFKMQINVNALVDGEHENTADLQYDDPAGSGTFTSSTEHLEYKLYYTGLTKIDGQTKEPLQGVWFQLLENGSPIYLKKSGTGNDAFYYPWSGTVSGTTGAAETNASGTIYFRGLGDKTYEALEVQALPGYNLLSGTLPLGIEEDAVYNESGVISSNFEYGISDVVGSYIFENNKGTVLPSTGGMGTTILYIAGAILVLGAGILLVTKRRANY